MDIVIGLLVLFLVLWLVKFFVFDTVSILATHRHRKRMERLSEIQALPEKQRKEAIEKKARRFLG